MTLTMADAVTPSEAPPGQDAYAGYIDGFKSFPGLVERFPHAYHLSIAIDPQNDAACLDIENGASPASAAPGWHRRQRAAGAKRPCFYANASTMPSVTHELDAAGIPRSEYRLWVADWDGIAAIPPGYDAKQFRNTAGYDLSIVADNFFAAVPPTPPPPDHLHYDWFQEGPFELAGRKLSERHVVETYDRLRKHPLVNRPRLHPIRDDLALLAGRIISVAEEDRQHGDPGFGKYRRQWRLGQILLRAEGHRLT